MLYEDGILVLDFGGYTGRSLARKVRSFNVFSQILPINAPIEQMTDLKPRGIIITGNADYDDASQVPDAVYELNLPILGIGYGARAMLKKLGGKLTRADAGSESRAVEFTDVELFGGLTSSERVFDRLDDIALPEGCESIARTAEGKDVAFMCREKRLYGMQFYPEANDPDGIMILRNFARGICGAEPTWSMESFLDWSLKSISEQVAGGHALIAISGGVDSAVCAALIWRAISDRLSLLHVDTGLMRRGECEMVREHFEALGMPLEMVECSKRFLAALSGVSDSDQKRAVVYGEYDRIVNEELERLGNVEFLAQGTIYLDVLDEPQHWSEPGRSYIEPLRYLFKDEVRELGNLLGLPAELVETQAFPGAGLALRCMGEVTKAKLDMLRGADRILREEIIKAGLDKRVRQYFCVLTDTKTMGNNGECGHTVVLRAVNPGAFGGSMVFRMPYDLLERVAARITTEVPRVNRVVYDITSQPPARVEWE